MLRLINQNRQLIETIQAILKMLPEGVMIQSRDKITNRCQLKFANIRAKIDILGGLNCDESLEELHDTNSKFKFGDDKPESASFTLTQILNHQTKKLELDDGRKKMETA